ncbi:MAG TPA: hydantoinase B/oxoprolinase family protein [Acidimicrobiales bacterium]|nr:hydantoinase B/oxoprolinase family protein [Acidimicrobiales bacterium]
MRADPILLELMRTRLEATAEEGALAIEQTAVSPIVAEGKDFSTNVFNARGEVLVGGGTIEYKWASAMNVVQTVIAQFGASISDGDVFASNDPHDGGGNHAADIEISRPVFADGELVAWIAASAHLIDVGGMTFGSWSPDATECFQEAVRFPPVRLFAEGTEQRDTWRIILNNVRLPSLVEMDIRGLVAGCHVAASKLSDLIASMGRAAFVETADAMCDNAESVLRSRIERIEPGRYSMDGWVEWGEERYHIPCSLTVAGGGLTFDFTGAPAQVPHFINSKAHIVRGQIVAELRNHLAQDLPFCNGIFRPISIVAEPGTIIDSRVPAPVASAHIDVSFNTSGLAVQCLRMALAASDDPTLPRLFHGQILGAMASHSWSYTTSSGQIDGWVVAEGFFGGSAGCVDRDGGDLGMVGVGTQSVVDFVDIEILEAWYPIEVLSKKPAGGPEGAGRFRSGGGCEMTYRIRGTDRVVGTMFAMREGLPMSGVAGGEPGAPTLFRVHRGDGATEVLGAHATNVVLTPSDVFEFHAGSGGGWGDPLTRDASAVERDVRLGRLSADDAREVYGVVPGDDEATARTRAARCRVRLASSRPPVERIEEVVALEGGRPLCHGVVQVGYRAVAEGTGAVLAYAPDHWTDGCPVLEERRASPTGTEWVARSYLDPVSGEALHVEPVPPGWGRGFETMPERWATASSGGRAR